MPLEEDPGILNVRLNPFYARLITNRRRPCIFERKYCLTSLVVWPISKAMLQPHVFHCWQLASLHEPGFLSRPEVNEHSYVGASLSASLDSASRECADVCLCALTKLMDRFYPSAGVTELCLFHLAWRTAWGVRLCRKMDAWWKFPLSSRLCSLTGPQKTPKRSINVIGDPFTDCSPLQSDGISSRNIPTFQSNITGLAVMLSYFKNKQKAFVPLEPLFMKGAYGPFLCTYDVIVCEWIGVGIFQFLGGRVRGNDSNSILQSYL